MIEPISDDQIVNVLSGREVGDQLTRDILANYLGRIQELENQVAELRAATST